METIDRTHRATSADGTEIVGRVHGHGPPLVLVHGNVSDGELDWGPLVSLLSDRFACFLPSTRGRGQSADNDDHSPPRIVEDVRAFVESIGEPAGVVGWSGGGLSSLGAAAGNDAVSGLVVYEPPVVEVIGEEDAAEAKNALARMDELATQGRLGDAALAFLEFVANDDELAILADAGDVEANARYVPVDLRELPQMLEADGASPSAPPTLARISAPVLVLNGSETRTWFAEGARHVADHVPRARLHAVAGAAHFGPVIRPDAVADEIVGFFAGTVGLA